MSQSFDMIGGQLGSPGRAQHTPGEHRGDLDTSSSSDESSISRRGACVYCSEAKRKCTFSQSNDRCNRCIWGDRVCEPQMPSRALTEAEAALNADFEHIENEINAIIQQWLPGSASRTRQSTQVIQTVLNRLGQVQAYNVTDTARIAFVREHTDSREDYWQSGASSNLLLRGLINEQYRLPGILLNQELSAVDANRLFITFMENWNHGLGLLDPALHSPRTILQRCPLLFTVVLAIASRDYENRPGLHAILTRQAKLSAAAALTDGLKSADTVQALLLMAAYPPPVRRYSDDRSLIYAQMAIQMAVDQKLQDASGVQAHNPDEQLELMNHIRTWRACVLIDSSNAAKAGWSPLIPLHESGAVIQATNSRDTQTGFEIRIFNRVNQFLGEARMAVAMDYSDSTSSFESDINTIADEIEHQQGLDMFHTQILKLTMDYARMIVYSFVFAKEHELAGGGSSLPQCVKYASSSILLVVEHIAPRPHPQFKYSPDAWFQYATFSAAFLIKLMCTPSMNYITDREDRERVAGLIKKLVDVYRSPEVTLSTNNHIPRMLAQFLESATGTIPEYQQGSPAGRGRGLSRSPPQIPSPPIAGISGQANPTSVLLDFQRWLEDWFSREFP